MINHHLTNLFVILSIVQNKYLYAKEINQSCFGTRKVGRWKTLLESGVGSQNLWTDQTVAKLLQKRCLSIVNGAGDKENQK